MIRYLFCLPVRRFHMPMPPEHVLMLPEGTLNSILKQFKAISIEEGEMIMYRFLVVIEKVNNNYSAYSPDLPGCVSTGATREEAEKNMYEAIEMHIQGLLEDNLAIPESKSFAEYMAVAEKSSIGQMA